MTPFNMGNLIYSVSKKQSGLSLPHIKEKDMVQWHWTNSIGRNGIGRNDIGRDGIGRDGNGRNGIGRNDIGRNGNTPEKQMVLYGLALKLKVLFRITISSM